MIEIIRKMIEEFYLKEEDNPDCLWSERTECLPETEPYFTRTASETWRHCFVNMRPVLERKDNE